MRSLSLSTGVTQMYWSFSSSHSFPAPLCMGSAPSHRVCIKHRHHEAIFRAWQPIAHSNPTITTRAWGNPAHSPTGGQAQSSRQTDATQRKVREGPCPWGPADVSGWLKASCLLFLAGCLQALLEALGSAGPVQQGQAEPEQ